MHLPSACAPLALRADGSPADAPTPASSREWLAQPLIRLTALVGIAAIVFLVCWFPTLFLGQLGAWWAPVQAVCLIVPVGVAYWCVGRFLERRRLVELDPARAAGVGWGALTGAVLMTAVVGLVWLLGGIAFHGVHAPTDWLPLLCIAGLQAGVAEEIVFRGIVHRYVEQWLGTWAAIAVSALVFGAAHLGQPSATMLSALAIAVEAGVLFALLYAWTRSLWFVMGLHVAWNLMQGLVFGIPVSGGRTVGVLDSSPTGPAWLSGGLFGVEASVVTPVLLGSLAVLLAVALRRRGLVVAPSWRRRVAPTGTDAS